MNWTKFFWMGGYGLYVWGSYGVTFLLLGAEVLLLVLKRKRDLARTENPRGTDLEWELENSVREIQ
jgi:heme exporter protein D